MGPPHLRHELSYFENTVRPLLKQLPYFNHLDYHYEWYNLLGAGQSPSIRIFQEKRLNMGPFFTKVIHFDEGLGAFDMLGLDMKTLQLHPKSAEKFVMKF